MQLRNLSRYRSVLRIDRKGHIHRINGNLDLAVRLLNEKIRSGRQGNGRITGSIRGHGSRLVCFHGISCDLLPGRGSAHVLSLRHRIKRKNDPFDRLAGLFFGLVDADAGFDILFKNEGILRLDFRGAFRDADQRLRSIVAALRLIEIHAFFQFLHAFRAYRDRVAVFRRDTHLIAGLPGHADGIRAVRAGYGQRDRIVGTGTVI